MDGKCLLPARFPLSPSHSLTDTDCNLDCTAAAAASATDFLEKHQEDVMNSLNDVS